MERYHGEDPAQNYKLPNCVQPYDHSRWGYRHQQAILLFVYLVIGYSARTCLGVVIVAMVDNDVNMTIRTNTTHNITNITVPHDDKDTVTDGVKTDGFLNFMLLTPPYPKVKWSQQQKGLVLSGFFWGYCVMLVPGGHLAHRFGTRRVLTVNMIINSVVLLLAPWLSYYGGWITMAVSRVIQGAAQGVMFPGMHAFFGKWTRLEERARLTNYTYSGVSVGLLVGLLIGGLASGSFLGWPGALRLIGVFAAVATAAVWFWLADTPEQHSSISYSEKRYIYEGIGVPDEKKRRSIPWKQILCHRGIMAIVAAHIANSFYLSFIQMEMPPFMANILKVNVKSIGLLMALPMLIMFLLSFVYGWISDTIIIRGWLSVVATRKLVNGFGFVLAAAGLSAMQFAPNDVFVVESLLIFSVSTKIASYSAFWVNHIDISPNYAGVLMSITSFVSYLVSAPVPLLAGLIVRDPASVEQWLTLFHVTAGILLSAAVLYQLFATADRASWDQSVVSEVTGEERKPMMTDEEVARNTLITS